MKTVRDACLLQENALSIKLSDQVEQLDELITNEGDGAEFLARTAITQGMQDLISEGIARLAGASNQAIFHLKQAMGGGKTHLLLGFGLLAKSPDLRSSIAGSIHGRDFGAAKTAAFNGRNSPDHFFWGEIATQLGKGDQFRKFWTGGPKAPDEKDWLQIFDGNEPILILLDELPPYFHDLDTQKVRQRNRGRYRHSRLRQPSHRRWQKAQRLRRHFRSCRVLRFRYQADQPRSPGRSRRTGPPGTEHNAS